MAPGAAAATPPHKTADRTRANAAIDRINRRIPKGCIVLLHYLRRRMMHGAAAYRLEHVVDMAQFEWRCLPGNCRHVPDVLWFRRLCLCYLDFVTLLEDNCNDPPTQRYGVVPYYPA